MSKGILIYTDGSCKGNPGPGGWAFLAIADSQEIMMEGSGGAQDTTNNRMEMQAMIEALKWYLTFSERDQYNQLTIISDSKLLINTLTRGWKKKANTDLWQDLDGKITKTRDQGVQILWKWVKGHAGHDYNERVDQLAVQATEKILKSKNPGRNSAGVNIVTSLPLTFVNENARDLRDLIDESFFICPNCNIKTAGVLSRKTDTGPVRVDCTNCGKYVKFAKLGK